MCGRFYCLEEDIDEYRLVVNDIEKQLLTKSGDFFPGDYAPVITPAGLGKAKPTDTHVQPVNNLVNQTDLTDLNDEVGRNSPDFVIHAVRWGFPTANGKLVFNARSETIATKSMFSVPFSTRRCLIRVRGFYEWSQPLNGKKKLKYTVSAINEDYLFLAGIYWFYKNTDGVNIPYFSILTTQAGEDLREIHNRMPVIVKTDLQKIWLYDHKNDKMLNQIMMNNATDYLSVSLTES